MGLESRDSRAREREMLFEGKLEHRTRIDTSVSYVYTLVFELIIDAVDTIDWGMWET